jgi:hypothetical protein
VMPIILLLLINYYYYYFDHEAWDLLRPLTQMVLSWNWFRKVWRDQDHYPPCWFLKRMNKKINLRPEPMQLQVAYK